MKIVFLFSYYCENNIIFILLEVNDFGRGVHNKELNFFLKGVHVFGKEGSQKRGSCEPSEPPWLRAWGRLNATPVYHP